VDEILFHRYLLYSLFGLAGFVLVYSIFVPAPYGRYKRPWWSGPDLPSWLAWMLMELPQPVGFCICFALAEQQADPLALIFLAIWMFHYSYRTFIYPFLPRASSMALAVVVMGFVLNCAFSYTNGRWLFSLGPSRDSSWFFDLRFILGLILFFSGWTLCTVSDAKLRRLRKSGEKGYQIPRGWAFRWVSSPNYLGELIMWAGWSLATWSLAGLAIAAISAANLIPRAWHNHRWYREKFPDYPSERKALVPFVF